MDLMSLRQGLLMGTASKNIEWWNLLKGKISGLTALFHAATLPETVELDFEGFDNIRFLESIFVSSNGVKTVRIKNLRSTKTNMSIRDMFYYNTSITAIEFINCEFSPQNWNETFRTTANLETISGELDFTNATSVGQIFNGTSRLREVRFKRDSLKISMVHANRPPLLSDDSLISIANGLDSSVTEQSIGFHDTPKARLATLMGDNVNGLFIANENGSLSLESFITTVKGWTLA